MSNLPWSLVNFGHNRQIFAIKFFHLILWFSGHEMCDMIPIYVRWVFVTSLFVILFDKVCDTFDFGFLKNLPMFVIAWIAQSLSLMFAFFVLTFDRIFLIFVVTRSAIPMWIVWSIFMSTLPGYFIIIIFLFSVTGVAQTECCNGIVCMFTIVSFDRFPKARITKPMSLMRFVRVATIPSILTIPFSWLCTLAPQVFKILQLNLFIIWILGHRILQFFINRFWSSFDFLFFV